MYRYVIKRLLDILFSFIFIIVLLPIFIIIFFLVRINLGSPVFFVQYRPGFQNRIFKIIKFRTMNNKKDLNGDLLPDKYRMTSFGTFLRSTSLDELPELINIFLGDMSFVGPRPQLIKDLVFMTDEEKHRHDVLPGLTGLAQVNGRNGIDWKTRFIYDLEYIDNISFVNDFRIICKTFLKVLKREGITEDNNVTSMDYGDFLLSISAITKDEYSKNISLSKKMLKGLT